MIHYLSYAGIAQLVERCLAKAKVAGSNPVSRSIFLPPFFIRVARFPFPANLIIAPFYDIFIDKIAGEKPRTKKQVRDTIAPIN